MLHGFLLATAAIACFLLTLLVRKYATKRAILDRPNDRSMHDRPVARGGGLAINLTFCAGIAALAIRDFIDVDLAIALLGGGVLVTLIGLVDDVRGGIRARARAAVHFAAAVWAVAWLGGVSALSFGTFYLELGIVGSVLSVTGIVWWINLYNFMDGIDGIAAGQAFSVAVIAMALLLTRGDTGLAAVAAIMAGAAAGFLPWNWSPARIFMGDIGSGFLGFVFAVVALASERTSSVPLVVWLVLSGVFIFDSTVTLARRVIRGEPFYTAHRSHAYQRLVLAGYRHGTVTAGVLAFNLILGALGFLALVPVLGTPFVVICAIVLLGGAYAAVEKLNPMPRTRRLPVSPF